MITARNAAEMEEEDDLRRQPAFVRSIAVNQRNARGR